MHTVLALQHDRACEIELDNEHCACGGRRNMDDPAYQKPGKGKKAKLQVVRRITITDTFRFSPKSFVETIRPLMKRGLIPKEVFDTIEREKKSAAGSIWSRWRTSKNIAAMSYTPLAFSCT